MKQQCRRGHRACDIGHNIGHIECALGDKQLVHFIADPVKETKRHRNNNPSLCRIFVPRPPQSQSHDRAQPSIQNEVADLIEKK